MYYIRTYHPDHGSIIINGIKLRGNPETLTEKLTNLNYVIKLGIPECYWFSKFKLVISNYWNGFDEN